MNSWRWLPKTFPTQKNQKLQSDQNSKNHNKFDSNANDSIFEVHRQFKEEKINSNLSSLILLVLSNGFIPSSHPSPFLLIISLAFCSNSEGNALHAFKVRVSDPKNVLQSWDPTLVNPCTWFHVTCDANNHVVRLDLGNSNISGNLGSELADLKHLRYLELYSNNIGGKIPKEFGSLENLISLDLYGNKFEGRIPKSFSKLKSLKFMRLNDNNLSGPIPRELTALSNLKVFDVSNNDLCGTIPADGPFGNFPMKSYQNTRIIGPELKGLATYDFGC